MNPPSAEVIEFGTKQPVSPAGIKQLETELGIPSDVDPQSPLGQIMTKTKQIEKEGKDLAKEFGMEDVLRQGLKGLDDTPKTTDELYEQTRKAIEEPTEAEKVFRAKEKERIGIPFQMGDVKGTASADELFDMITKNPYRSGGPLDPKSGIVRTAARQILRKKLDAGEIDIPDATERDAIAKGYQGGVDPIEVFRKRFGEDALQDLDEIADELNRAGDFKEIDNILNKNKLFDIKPKAKYEPDPGAMSDEELAALLKKSEDETPDEFATGGRVGFAYGSLPKGIQKLYRAINKKFGKGTIKTADELENPKRPLTDEEIQMYEEELGDSETWMSSGTLEEAENALKRQKEYEAAMYTDYKAGRLDPQPGEKGRREFLEKKLEEMEMSGDKKIMTTDEIEELSNMDLEAEMNVSKGLAPKMVERLELKQKYPGISDELLDKILIDDNVQRKAEVLATLDEALKMMEKGKGPDEVLSTIKNVTRTKQASGGLAYLMGL